MKTIKLTDLEVEILKNLEATKSALQSQLGLLGLKERILIREIGERNKIKDVSGQWSFDTEKKEGAFMELEN